ncbi:hypothetical protein IGM04_002313 [Enterococcus sp. DIV2385]|nr:hypothetical protein P789_0346 [Enterococcus faecalis MTmid8]KAJ72983.1 hypothetical protein P786_0632 [Enterococcus faecalis MD6]KAJ80251.1 hypothetical protein P784_0676 [Enterococcus faecalis GAN13]KAJ83552.1 hypothetical protein P791_2288 [Enterococcus faecalis NY9]OTP13276.1 hypothetical protein A5830_002536 [Enterococcus faecalis]
MGNRVYYPIHIKEMAIQMKKENISVKTIMEELGIKNKTQIETWRRWYRNARIIVWFNPLENNMLMEKVQKIYQMNNNLKMKITI